MSFISQTTTHLQIFCELSLYSQIIFKSMRVADDTFQTNSECEWVKHNDDDDNDMDEIPCVSQG